MVTFANLDGLSHTELKNLMVTLFDQRAERQRTIAALRDEIARPRPARNDRTSKRVAWKRRRNRGPTSQPERGPASVAARSGSS
jgi:hypothetical protein